jgi:protein-disulfide isomerase
MTPKQYQHLRLALTMSLMTISVVSAQGMAVESNTVGQINGQPITLADVEAQAKSTLSALEENLQRDLARLTRGHARTNQRIREAALSALIDRRVLELEAEVAGRDIESLLNSVTVPKVEDKDILDFYNTHRNNIDAPFDEAKAGIHDRLQKQAHDYAIHDFLTNLRAKYHATGTLEPLRESVGDHGPSRGPANAAVTLIEFADFQCPYCAQLEPVLAAVQARYPNQVRVVFRQLPIPQLHPDAERLSAASICADEQRHFWQFHDAVFQTPGRYDTESVLKLINRLDLNPMEFQACMESGRPMLVLRHEVAEADILALEGTPAVFLNGQLLTGALSVQALSDAIDAELKVAAK